MKRASGAANRTIASKRERVNHSRHRRLRARADIRSRASDRAGGRQASEERRENIGDALRHEFDVRIVLVAAHAVGNHCGHQRFDRSEHCDGDGRRNQRAQQVKTKLRHLQLRQAGGNSAESRADRFHRKLEKGDDRRSDEEGHDVAGHFFHVSRKEKDECEGQHAEACFKRRKSSEIPRENFDARQEFSGNFVDFEPEEILDLSAGDDYGNSICETHYHGPRNVFHRCAEPRDSENHQQHARHQRAHVQAVQAVPRDNPVHNDNERPGRSADLSGGTS